MYNKEPESCSGEILTLRLLEKEGNGSSCNCRGESAAATGEVVLRNTKILETGELRVKEPPQCQ